MNYPEGFRALSHRPFRVHFLGQLVGLTGSWMQTVAQAWLVLQLTGSPLRLGLISTLQFAPVLLFSLLTGAVADRLPKRRVIVATQTIQAGLALVLALLIVSGRVRYWHVGVVAVLWGLANVVDQPARQSLVAELVEGRDVVSAVGLNAAAFNSARIVGPAVAGVLIARVGIAPSFLLNAMAFTVAIGTLLAIAIPPPTPGARETTLLQEVREGVAYALGTPRVRLVLGLLLVASFCVFNFSVYVPLLARQVLGLGPEGYGFLMTAVGVGAVGAGLVLGARGSRASSLGALGSSLAAALGGLLGLGAIGQFWVAAALLAVTGFAGTMVVAGCNSSLQLLAPDRLRGRVMSLYILVSGGVFPIGAFFAGAVSEAWGVSRALSVNGALGLVALASLLAWWRLRRS